MPRASIIICTRDRAASLRRTLAALNHVDVPAGMTAEVIVVDNASTDDTAAAVREAHLDKMALQYLFEPQPGQSRARNRGMAAATGEVIVFTDDDVIPESTWLAFICAPILEGSADAVVGAVRLAPHLSPPWLTPAHRAWLADTSGLDAADPGRMVGANMAFSRAVLDRVPAFDVELGPGAIGFGDDTLFSQQLKAAGYQIAAEFRAVVEHHFLENRLLPEQWLASARRLGHSDAYMSYHWENSVWPHPRRMVCSAFLRILEHRLRALVTRSGPVASEAHLVAVRSLHAALNYLAQTRRPRNYSRCGLVKHTYPVTRQRAAAAAAVGRAESGAQEGEGPRVTVIIPAYRWRRYLSLALESVFSQTYTDYEIIVVNDGSPDDLAGSLRALIDSGRIRYIEQKHGGVAAARNRGVAEARGEFLAFLDDDDLWPADTLEWRVARLAENKEAVLVYGGVSFLEGDREPDHEAGIFPEGNGPAGAVYQEFLTRNWLYALGQALIRTGAVRAIGGFDTAIWGVDDYDLYIELAKRGTFIYEPRRALFYRTHPENASKNIWQMHCNTSKVRRKHLGRLPSPANWRPWLANFRFWSGVFGRQLLTSAETALRTGDKKAARQMWWYALRAQPTLLRRRQFLTLGLSLR